MRVDAPAAWLISVILLTSLVAFGYWLMLKTLAGATAQHLEGTRHEYELHVVDVTRLNGRRNQCLVEVQTREIEGFAAASFCINPRHGDAIGPEDLEAGEKVRLETRSTALGTVAVSVRRIS